MAPATVTEHRDELDGQPLFWRSAPTAGGRAPVLYLHGVPTSSDDWVAFLELTGGIAPDLPGFGRSGKRGDGDYTMAGYERFVGRFLEHAGAERVRLLVHDWGAVGLLWAMRNPERVERVVVMNAVPLLPGYRWHRIARVWRTRGAGELMMGATNRTTMRLLSRDASAADGPLPERFLDQVLEHFDQGTQRAILRLYRTSPEDELAVAGERLGELRCPALVVWGDRDPYIAASFADGYAAALGGRVRLRHVPAAGHWPWLEQPELIGEIAEFLDGDGGER
jgi:pimeloyl-ACP methyl ester carboxylesterase